MLRVLQWVYQRLTRNEAPCRVDLIFVLAGKMERKQYGLELYRTGVGRRLLLSVGRFEVRKMPALGIPLVADLIAMRERTPPKQRHFFYEINAAGIRISRPDLISWNTYGEAVGLREYLAGDPPMHVVVVSSDLHLRRAALTFETVFRGSTVRFHYCPVPERQSSVREDRWWSRPADRKYVIGETIKLIGYRTVLMLPEFIVRRCMRLLR